MYVYPVNMCCLCVSMFVWVFQCAYVCVSWYEFNNSSCSYSGSLLEYLHHYVNPLYSPYPNCSHPTNSIRSVGKTPTCRNICENFRLEFQFKRNYIICEHQQQEISIHTHTNEHMHTYVRSLKCEENPVG